MQVLSSNSQKILLAFARETIAYYLEKREYLEPMPEGEELSFCAGCFVTLRKQGNLRGCIGTFDFENSFVENLSSMAVAAAFEDPRFPAVTKSELNDIRIDISILDQPKKMNSVEELEIGKHGILVRMGWHSGTYLPDVATEQKWDREQFVRHCAIEKAGIAPAEAHKAEYFIYEVQKISDPAKSSSV